MTLTPAPHLTIGKLSAATGVKVPTIRFYEQAGLLPELREYARTFGLSARHLESAAPGALVLHPGPINRGVEIDSSLADARESLILDQVAAGVAVRMALLFLYVTRKEGGA